MKWSSLLDSLALEARFRTSNTLRRAHAHPWDTAWTVFVTGALIVGVLLGARRAYFRHREFLTMHRETMLLESGAMAVVTWTVEALRVTRTHLHGTRWGWRQHLPFSPSAVFSAGCVLAGIRGLPALAAFAAFDAAIQAAHGAPPIPTGATAAVLATGVLAAFLVVLVEMSRRASSRDPARRTRFNPRAFEVDYVEIGESVLAARSERAGFRLRPPLGWGSSRVLAVRPRHLAEVILLTRNSSGVPIAKGWIPIAVSVSVAVLALAALESPALLFAIPIGAAALLRFPAPTNVLWLGRHLPLGMRAVLRSHVVVGVLELLPLWMAALVVVALAPGFRVVALVGLAISCLLLVWRLLTAFAEPSSRFRRALLEIVGLGLAIGSILFPAAPVIMVVLIAWCARRAADTWRVRDVEEPI